MLRLASLEPLPPIFSFNSNSLTLTISTDAMEYVDSVHILEIEATLPEDATVGAVVQVQVIMVETIEGAGLNLEGFAIVGGGD